MPTSKKLTLEEWIIKAREVHGDKYDYSNSIYINSRTKIVISCLEHGDFEQLANMHLQGNGCPKCSKMMRSFTQEKFIEKANQVHNNFYDYSKAEYIKSSEKVCIICPEHGEFWQVANNHLIGQGCLKCGRKKIIMKISLTGDTFIEKAKLVHGKNRYDYSKVEYVNSKSKVCIICPEHGEFWQIANDHLLGRGCSKCGSEMTAKQLNMGIDKFILNSKEIHGDRYDYSKVIYIDSYTKVIIICPIHGIFTQIPNSHLQGRGCPRCSKVFKLNKDTFIGKAKLVHNDKYDYSKINYINSKTKIEIYCKKCKEYFWQTPGAHLKGQGCAIHQTSKGEKAISTWLINNNIIFKPQYRSKDCKNVRSLPFDFYIKDLNICIEYDGINHYRPFSFGSDQSEETKNGNLKNVQFRDNIKNQYCKDNGIKLLRIPYWKINDIEEILNEVFLK